MLGVLVVVRVRAVYGMQQAIRYSVKTLTRTAVFTLLLISHQRHD